MSSSELRQRVSPNKVIELNNSDDELPTFTPPNYTIKELLNVIPARCFERSALKSSAYVAWDFALIAALGTAIYQVQPFVGVNGSFVNGQLGVAAKALAWMTYWWFQGLIMTGVWVIAHECGHQSYSTSKTINNAVGWVLHSALLVPYHSWRISHARHHAATGHMTRDEVFVPRTASQKGVKTSEPSSSADGSILDKVDDLLEDAPLWVALNLIGQQVLGWPMYLINNVSGQLHYPEWTNHFSPSSVIFDKRHFGQIIVSDLGLAAAFAALFYATKMTSLATVIAYYGIPYLLVNHWLVCITFLQHTDIHLPHYRAGEWNFQRGALCTQDRNVYNFFTHEIASTHVAHHLSSKIPHYHAAEATEALKKFLGEHYKFSSEFWLVSLWKSFRECRYVDDEDEVVFFRNAKGKVHRKVVYDNGDSGVDGL